MPTNDTAQFRFTAPLGEVKMDKSGDPAAKGAWTFRGHAAVFNRLSHDLGGFRVRIAPGAFTKVLDQTPDVHMNREHDMRLLLARTKNNSLELREDPMGLHAFARFAKTPLADETAILMDGGYLDQMSFACDIGASEWTEDAQGNITRTITEVDALYDVCICAQGAFPQTDAQLVASFRDASHDLAAAIDGGLILRKEENPDLVAARGEKGDDIAPEEGVADVAEQRRLKLAALKAETAERFAQHAEA